VVIVAACKCDHALVQFLSVNNQARLSENGKQTMPFQQILSDQAET
jgi:hypothetical protein